MDYLIYILFTIIIILVTQTIYFISQKYSYFKRFNVPTPLPRIPFGNFKRSEHLALTVTNVYKQLKQFGPIGGMYVYLKPFCIPLSASLVKRILIEDFQYFETCYNERDESLMTLNDEKWRQLRNRLAPAFSSDKMKFIFSTMIDVGKQLELHLDDSIKNDDLELEFKELMQRFTIDVIGTCALGIQCNCIMNPNEELYEIGRMASKYKYGQLMMFIRSANNKYDSAIVDNEIKEYFLKTIRQTIAIRRMNQISGNDFMDILMNLKTTDDDDDDHLSFAEIAAQIFTFFDAGYETTSATLTFALSELAAHPSIQNKVRDEINTVLAARNGELTYESLGEMEYLDQIVQETLRMHPPIGIIERRVSKAYPIAMTNQTLPVGLSVFIPTYAMHHDPEFYPNPMEFQPERFDKANIKTKPNNIYLPFGYGPRNCIGMKFGLMQIKFGLIMMLRNYEIKQCSKTIYPLEYLQSGKHLMPSTDVWLQLKKII